MTTSPIKRWRDLRRQHRRALTTTSQQTIQRAMDDVEDAMTPKQRAQLDAYKKEE